MATEATEELYRVRDTYFPTDPADKASKIQTLADAALAQLDSIPLEQRKSPQQRAMLEFLKGKILDVKLNPSLVDAWLCLGNCIWKKGDLISAKSCFTHALSKGSNKKVLCQLSMLERSMSQGKEDQATLVDESIKHAKEAANKYLENYERALHRFEAAASQDPSLGGDEEVRKIINVLDKLDNSVKVRNKRLASTALNLSEVRLEPAYKKATVNSLSEGINSGAAVLAKVLLFIKHDNIAPLYYLLCDSNMCCFILSVFGLQFEAVREGDNVTLLGPYYRAVDVSWKGKHYQFKLIRVDFAEQILVNGNRPSLRHVARASIISQNKS
ncbi:tetratricopeptide repeat protein 5-like isoform X2 [Carex littledalei]|uniref:Tetratricopeptide repeat protein 5-like isoform X2 n=1 Tax=Carex littledalei TaxID=544730 RepID=A0A833VGY2_9POAL|nr:tetratricopeptide repeat protein 5-like isoform X2 [Carex littledalei]